MSYLKLCLTRLRNRAANLSMLDRQLVGVALAVIITVTQAASFSPIISLRERIADRVLAPAAKQIISKHPIVVVIDRKTLAKVGPWPWGRDQMAALVAAVGAAKPRAVAVDILFAGPGTRSPAARARALSNIVSSKYSADLLEFSKILSDGDDQLAQSLSKSKVVIGIALDPLHKAGVVSTRSLPIRGQLNADQLWRTAGWVGSIPVLAKAASGIGVLALRGDPDGIIRRAPLLAIVGTRAVPGLALELYRASNDISLMVIDGPTRMLRAGAQAIPLRSDGQLRLINLSAEDRAVHRISALSVLEGDVVALSRLRDAVVMIGGTAPELGGMRAQADGELVASVDLQATAYAQIASGTFPFRPSDLTWMEILALILASAAGVFLARQFAPLPGVIIAALAGTGWVVLANVICQSTLLVLDPIIVPVAGFMSFAGAVFLVENNARIQASRIRSRFEQHLAPAVVQRIVDSPDSLRLKGEMREITSLFTDIAGFTVMTDRTDNPEQLIDVLDGYFDGLTRIAVAHGALVDKFVGDAMHALFNAPVDLQDHATRALACAIELDKFADRYRLTPAAKALGLGKTRIGIETGDAIVGDIGGKRKLDYTAHGRTVNAAARLEQANKIFDTTILIGPGAAEKIDTELMPLGDLALRGFDKSHSIYTVWPSVIQLRDRDRVSNVINDSGADPKQKSQRLEDLGKELDAPLLAVLAKHFRDNRD